ncbi:hypothetical protein [Mycolicibacterium bacteremicum]|uniref:Uncharacterized protein n=1 Tax=Mycolicibacterium bacteremicum TaxID=564198 RepID=A0A1W9YR95_MYCBA|nr:hypothetical protein [Mycolicibacterium bacteremicum]MCV7433544.1 hypothetical protein [Mycolicibacterium bacteremicum]ORA02611.1 hypothetical protein BST17_22565 [Mycolicibacterium bacteremicum]
MSNEHHLATRRPKDDPLFALVGMIRHAVADPVRSAGGNKADVEAIAVAAAYAAWCWGAATDESAPQPLRCG